MFNALLTSLFFLTSTLSPAIVWEKPDEFYHYQPSPVALAAIDLLPTSTLTINDITAYRLRLKSTLFTIELFSGVDRVGKIELSPLNGGMSGYVELPNSSFRVNVRYYPDGSIFLKIIEDGVVTGRSDIRVDDEGNPHLTNYNLNTHRLNHNLVLVTEILSDQDVLDTYAMMWRDHPVSSTLISTDDVTTWEAFLCGSASAVASKFFGPVIGFAYVMVCAIFADMDNPEIGQPTGVSHGGSSEPPPPPWPVDDHEEIEEITK